MTRTPPAPAALAPALAAPPPTAPPPPPAPTAPPPPALRAALTLAAFSCGALAAVQGSVNAALGARAGYGTLATLISFSSGLAILSAVCAAEARGAAFLRWRAAPRAALALPGPLGVAFVSATVLLTPTTGFALLWICIVAGQLGAAALADARGWGVAGGARLPVSRARAAALALTLTGVALSVGEQLGGGGAGGGVPAARVAGFCLLGVATGAGTLAQSVLNREAAALLPSKLAATFWSFLIGTLAAAAVFGAHAAAAPAELGAIGARLAAAEGWTFAGGALGVVYVAGSIFVPAVVGSQVYAVALVCGQLATSAVIDSRGAFGARVAQLSALKGAGLAVVLIAAALTQLAAAPAAPALAKAAAAAEGEGELMMEGARRPTSSG
jgi:transporter family-2 protein